jgi:hypothetical protein
VLAIEQTICTIKERIYAIASQLPLKTYPHTGVDKTTGNTHKQNIHEDTTGVDTENTGVDTEYTGVDTENTGVDTENTSSIREQELQTTHMTN